MISVQLLKENMKNECKRCGRCCAELVKKDFWKTQTVVDKTPFKTKGLPMVEVPLLNKEEVELIEKHIRYEGKGCEAMIMKDGEAVCLIQRHLGYDRKCYICKGYPGKNKCLNEKDINGT
jgi:hypothetical protein